MARLNSWDVTFRPGGWIRAKSTDEDTTVYLRVRESNRDGPSRLNVHTAVMTSERPISSHLWRYVPVEHVEQHANEKNFRRALKLEPDEFGGGPAMDDLESYFVDDSGEPWQPSLTLLLRDAAAGHGTRAAKNGTQGADSAPPKLSHPGRRITDDFLRELAVMYRWLVSQGQPPAPEIAKQVGAPVGTVHRWVAVARKREFLPPGRVGRAG